MSGEVPHGTNLIFGLARARRRPGAAPAASAVSGASVRRILAPQTRRATSFHTCCSHLPGDLPKGLQNDGIGGFGMRTRLWRAAEGGSRAPTRPLDRSNLNFDDRETVFATDLGHPHSPAVGWPLYRSDCQSVLYQFCLLLLRGGEDIIGYIA